MTAGDIIVATGIGPRRYTIQTVPGPLGTATHYGPWVISFDPPPIPTRNFDWQFVHRDYDGAPDSGDNRCGSAASLEDALNECDRIEDEEPQS